MSRFVTRNLSVECSIYLLYTVFALYIFLFLNVFIRDVCPYCSSEDVRIPSHWFILCRVKEKTCYGKGSTPQCFSAKDTSKCHNSGDIVRSVTPTVQLLIKFCGFFHCKEVHIRTCLDARLACTYCKAQLRCTCLTRGMMTVKWRHHSEGLLHYPNTI